MKGTGKLYWFAFLIFVGFVIAFSAQKICSFDIWWHLKAGEWIWQNKAIPHTDPFSYTFKGVEWIDFEWLFQAAIYPLWKVGGYGGLIIFKIAVILLTFFILFLTCRKLAKDSPWLTLIVLLIALNVAKGRFMVRPHILFLLFVASSLYLLTLYREGLLSPKRFLLLILGLQIIWVNFHSSFLIGILLVGSHLLGRFIPLAIEHRKDLRPLLRDERLRWLFFTCLLLVIFSMANPYGPNIYLLPIKTMKAKEVLREIAEWVPLDIRILGLLVTDPTVWFRGMFLLGVVSFLIRKDNLKKVEDLLIFATFSYLSFKHHRFSALFAVTAAPIILSNLAYVKRRPGNWLRYAILLVIIGLSFRDMQALIKVNRLGLTVWDVYPKATVKFLKNHRIQGNIFNTYGLGGYLIWHLWPEIPVFIDGRTPTIYDQDFFWLYSLAERKKDIWEKVVKDYSIDIVLIRDDRELGYAKLCNWLDENERWRLVAFDDKSVLYLRKDSFPELTERWGFKYLRPSDLSMDYAKGRKDDEDFLRALGEELKEACRRFPRDFYPFYYLAIYHQIYGTEEHLKEAVAALRKAIANRPHFARGYYELGFTLLKLKRSGEAVTALKKAISLRPDLPSDAYYYLGASYYQMGDIDRAIKALEKYKRKAGLGTRVEAYRFLGRAYLQKYKLRKALSCFKREAYLEPTWETYANMGIAYFGLNKLKEARKYFEKAMFLKPDELKVLYNLAVTYEKLGFNKRAKDLYEKLTLMKITTDEEKEWIEKAKLKLRKLQK